MNERDGNTRGAAWWRGFHAGIFLAVLIVSALGLVVSYVH